MVFKFLATGSHFLGPKNPVFSSLDLGRGSRGVDRSLLDEILPLASLVIENFQEFSWEMCLMPILRQMRTAWNYLQVRAKFYVE